MPEKEIGKLLELFKEYVDNYGTDTKDLEKEYGVIDDGQGFLYGTREYSYLTLISKSFGFIQRLVEQDKIDKRQVHILCGTDDMEYNYSEEELILMELAIQDNPIEFLISILK